MAFDPVDFIARLAALVPKPRVNLTRYHGVLAPNHRWRGEVTPAKRGKGAKRIANTDVHSPAERHVAMSWAQRLKRVFNIDIEVCGHCGGSVKVIACIEDQDVIDSILAHLREKGTRPPYPIAPGATLPSTPWAITSFRRTRIHSPKSARTLLKNAWHGRLHAIVQEWTDMHCAITSANNFSGQSVVISRISPFS